MQIDELKQCVEEEVSAFLDVMPIFSRNLSSSLGKLKCPRGQLLCIVLFVEKKADIKRDYDG